ncbi:MAG: hypothetical protein ACREX3_24250 [Gammaproteobacteria bacterium]
MAAAISVSMMMMLLIITLSFSFFPYLERFKSHREFSQEIGKIVPAAASLYVYADTMNDFNYYTQRETIPVLGSLAEVAGLRDRPKKSYLLIKKRDLKKLFGIPSEWIVASNSPDNATWYLVELNHRPAN